MAVAMERLSKHVPAATDMRATIAEELETIFSTRYVPRYDNRDGLEKRHIRPLLRESVPPSTNLQFSDRN
jgi:hypothetical protein